MDISNLDPDLAALLEDIPVAPSAPASPLDLFDDIGDVPHIRGKRELEVPLSDMVADILSAVVRYGEGFDGEARQREGLTDGYIPSGGAYRVLDEATMRYTVVHQTSGIDRQVVDSADDTYGAYMVGMVVGDEQMMHFV